MMTKSAHNYISRPILGELSFALLPRRSYVRHGPSRNLLSSFPSIAYKDLFPNFMKILIFILAANKLSGLWVAFLLYRNYLDHIVISHGGISFESVLFLFLGDLIIFFSNINILSFHN